MNISIFQQTNPVGSNTLVMAIYKNSAPTILIASFPLPGPYTGQTQLHTFSGVPNVVYNYKLYESADTTPAGTVRNYFDVQPNKNTYNTRDDLYLVANTSPFLASGTSFYGPDPSLVGWNWSLEQPGGVGTLAFGVDYVKTIGGVDTTQDDTNATGWRFLDPTNLIGDGQKFFIHFQPQLAATSTPSSGTFIANTQLLIANTTLDNSAVGQSFLLQGGGGFIGVTLPDINTVPDNMPIFFSSNGGSHINAGIICFAGQKLQWYDNQTNLGSNTLASALNMGQCESGYVYRFTYPDSSKKWIVSGMDGRRVVGEIVYQYSKIPLNTVFAKGQLLSRANYAGLWAYVQNLESGILIAESSYNDTVTVNGRIYQKNWAKYSTGDGSTTFRVPTLWLYGFQRAKNGAVGSLSYNGIPGDFYPQVVGIHDHATHGKGPILQGVIQWFLSILNNRYSNGGGSDKLGGKAGSPDTDMRTSDNTNGNAQGENLPSSTGIYALIRT